MVKWKGPMSVAPALRYIIAPKNTKTMTGDKMMDRPRGVRRAGGAA